ncbi:MAG: ribulokinase [Chitinophagaceae bacterium]|nr:ribulokinase [Chitinophagaceae bacterium]
MEKDFVIGLDFGTDSVRAIVVNGRSGDIISSSVANYHRWNRGLFCKPSVNQFRQHPLDHIEGMKSVVNDCLDKAGNHARERVRCISVASTGSTPIGVNKHGIPLSLTAGFEENPNAMFILWKDHSSIEEADEINRAAKSFETDYLKYVGGSYSPEWYWAKLLHVLRTDSAVRGNCYTWVEHSDWIPFLLTGGEDARDIKRNVCAAGHKGLWADEFGGMPPEKLFKKTDPVLIPFRERFGKVVFTADQPAGNLGKEWAQKFGLSDDVLVGIGALDAHIGAVGGNIKPYYLSKVIGTSTCDLMVVPKAEMEGVFIRGISGQVEGSVIPGMVGLEAGQSAFGDIYSWFRDLLLWPVSQLTDKNHTENDFEYKLKPSILRNLDGKASAIDPSTVSEFAIDWFNGRRTPFVNPNVKGMIGGLTLGSDAPEIYRALVESTCFGSRAIVESIEEQGIGIKAIQALGGIAVRSKFVVQMMADILDRPVIVSPEEQTVALGAAMFATVVCGIHKNIAEAQQAFDKNKDVVFNPDQRFKKIYDDRYKQYRYYGKMQE